MDEEAPPVEEIDTELIQSLSDAFDTECQVRHDMGERKYGPVKFMTVNSIEEALAEIVDLANYARYTYIKLALLAASGPVEPLIGPKGFIPEAPVQTRPDGFFSPYRSTE